MNTNSNNSSNCNSSNNNNQKNSDKSLTCSFWHCLDIEVTQISAFGGGKGFQQGSQEMPGEGPGEE